MRRILWISVLIFGLNFSLSMADPEGRGKEVSKEKSTTQKQTKANDQAAEGHAFGKDQEKINQNGFSDLKNSDSLPPGHAKSGTVPPGLEKNGRVPPGLHKEGKVPPGLEKSGRVPPGLHKEGKVPPGLHKEGKVPPGHHVKSVQLEKNGPPSPDSGT